MGEAGGDLCRVTLVAPRMRLDVALPAAVPLATLLPTLLWHCGEQLAEEGLDGGWAIQRVGDPPLDTGATMSALGVKDGDILHLRPRQDAMPAPVSDDTVDAIATALREHARRWGTRQTRAAALAAAGLLVVCGAVLLAGSGLARPILAAVAGAAAIGAVAGAAAASRAFGDAIAGTVLGGGALPFGFLAGFCALPVASGGAGGAGHGAFLVAAGALLVTAAAAAVAVGDPGSLLTGAVAAGFLGVGCSVIALFSSGAGGGAAAVVLALALSPAIAPAAYRMSGLPQPAVPASTDELRTRGGGDSVSIAEVGRRTLAADRMVAALVAATGVVAAAGVAIMLPGGGWAAEVLAVLAAGLLLLRARVFSGVAQRSWLIGSGLAALAEFSVLGASRIGVAGVLGFLCALAVAATAACAVAISPGRGRALTLARASDVAELLGVVATIPLALQVLHVFSLVRSLGG